MNCLDCGMPCTSTISLAYHLRHFHEKLACARCGKSFTNRATFTRHLGTHLKEITAPPNSLIGVEDGADTPRNAQESRDQCNALGAFPGTEAFANGAWRWRRPAPRPWFALDESTSSVHLEEYYRMMKKHVRERRFNFLQWIADRGRPLHMDAMSTLPWLAVDDPNDDCESLDDDVLGRRAQAASEALFEEIRALPATDDAAAPEDDDIEIDDMILQNIQ